MHVYVKSNMSNLFPLISAVRIQMGDPYTHELLRQSMTEPMGSVDVIGIWHMGVALIMNRSRDADVNTI